MPAVSGNGTVLTFASVPRGDVVSIRYNEAGAEIRATTLTSTAHVYEAGLPDVSVDVTTAGVSSISFGDVGALAVSYVDAAYTDEALSNSVCTRKEVEIDIDGEMVTSMTFRQAV